MHEQPKTPHVDEETTGPKSSGVTKGLLWGAWVGYVGYLLLSELPPGDSLLHTRPETLQEAIALSLNFWFVMPVAFPKLAPVLHPALEGLFNLVVTWGLLFWGFAIDGRQQRWAITPFLVGTALLTNVFYLPWLALRAPNIETPKLPLTRLESLGESKAFPLVLASVLVASLGWAAFARPEFGDIATRWAALLALIGRDRLAYSFFVDLLVFWLFQGWLVRDDMARRQWHNPLMLWIARLVPFVGLLLYFWRRPRLLGDRAPGPSSLTAESGN